MISASKKRGIDVTSISRPIRPTDFRDFDLILAMDRQNYGTLSIHSFFLFQYLWIFVDLRCLKLLSYEQYAEDILNAFERWRHKEPLPDNGPNKVGMLDCLSRHFNFQFSVIETKLGHGKTWG
jgi:protein-tyrosine phosphatase